MARLLFSTHDPGGANVLLPVMRLARARGHEVAAAAGGPAAAIWREAGEALAEGAAAPFARRPDLVVTGAGAGDFDRNLWRGARAARIKTIAILDSWSQIDRRFVDSEGRSDQPDAVVAVDEAMAEAMRALPNWRARVHVGGQAHLEETARRLAGKRDLHVANDPPLIAFFSECLREDYPRKGEAFDQFAIGGGLLDAIAACAPVRLAIKPHPREKTDEWRRFLNDREIPAGVSAEISETPSEKLMLAADVVVGKTTMMLIEAILADVPILWLRPGHPGPIHPMIDGLPGEVVTDARAAPEALKRVLAAARRPGPARRDLGSLGGMIRDAAERTLAAIEREGAGTP